MSNLDDAKFFDGLVSEKLGHHVYVLIDPRNHQPFYIGKGGGKEGQGNNRVLSHFEEARAVTGSTSEKAQRIRDIWAAGHDVVWKIVRHGLPSEQAAFDVECALIDLLNDVGPGLSNMQSGHGRQQMGLKSKAELKAWAATPIDAYSLPDHLRHRPIYLFNIARGVQERQTKHFPTEEGRYLEATCQFWKCGVAVRAQTNAVAVGCIAGISRIAFEIAEWSYIEAAERWEILPGRNPDNNLYEQLLFKSFDPIIQRAQGYWMRGNFIGFSFLDRDQAHMIRGSADRALFSI